MKIKTTLFAAAALLLVIAGWAPVVSAEDGTKMVYEAAGVLKEIMAIPEKGILPASRNCRSCCGTMRVSNDGSRLHVMHERRNGHVTG